MEENKILKEQVNKHEQLLDVIIGNFKSQSNSSEIRMQALNELAIAEKNSAL